MSHNPKHSIGCPGRLPGALTRREMLKTTSNGFGWMAFTALLTDKTHAAVSRAPAPHYAPQVKNVIFCFMPGGVSHVDTFDPKPHLAKHHGKDIGGWLNDKSQGGGKRTWKECPWKFGRHGESGLPVSELFPYLARCADEIAVIRSMVAEVPLHAGGNLFLHTGQLRAGSPSLGSWITYGLGSENENLPGYVLLNSGSVPPGGKENFSNGFLPATYQATPIQAEGVPVANIVPADANPGVQPAKLEWLLEQDRAFSASLNAHDAIESAIRNHEMAFRMQTAVPDILDLSRESKAIRRLYGVDSKDKQQRLYAVQCLRARRLIESGVRFVEITGNPLGLENGSWDQHTKLKEDHEKNALVTDQPIAALMQDLKARGLLEETLILCAGEMGRTPHTGNGDGRDHHVAGFSVWLAGGGIKGGTAYGATDEFGMNAVENVVTMNDLHATILHLLGLDHERLTYPFSGRHMRLTDSAGHVVDGILA